MMWWEDFEMRRWFFGCLAGVMLLTGAATVISRAYDLAWFPWEVKMNPGKPFQSHLEERGKE